MRAAAIDFYMWTGAVIKIADVQTPTRLHPLCERSQSTDELGKLIIHSYVIFLQTE